MAHSYLEPCEEIEDVFATTQAGVADLGGRLVALSSFAACALPFVPVGRRADLEGAFRRLIAAQLASAAESSMPAAFSDALMLQFSALMHALRTVAE
ncbi:hypothetical protein [Ralstonia solanacearum]|uniref:hypothetical protein n=1 Tax=Ralstonia solanacearum TaxID=305 RepID=UPI00044D142D|nr:hypothetical protein [Ralstonia solanacearum]EUJ13189.1 hypothetical protein RSP673_16980 [Ralstonia solanacearum P673]MCL9843935.1 hypothetical protein [Ralstonia solanacearum]MCL9848565.1 hypothetical protein [Ralstonia solanacearum]MCL9855633.1 hypothetical protein [Ralstonia solanacearum]MCL9857988.1 hypothetical protein [Ralstonia solanacearum]